MAAARFNSRSGTHHLDSDSISATPEGHAAGLLGHEFSTSFGAQAGYGIDQTDRVLDDPPPSLASQCPLVRRTASAHGNDSCISPAAGLELRLPAELGHYWNEVIASSVGYSGIRLRNARGFDM